MSTSENTPAAGPSLTALTTTDTAPRWTAERQSAFLTALASTHSVAAAARAAGMSRQSAYALRARLKGEPFDLAWTAALQCRFDALAEAAMERALNGVEVPHFHKGELVHTSRRYDERLTVALLAMRERLGLPYMGSTHPGFVYRGGEFGPLIDRVERGPDTWKEERRLEREALYGQDEAYDEDYDEAYDESDDGEYEEENGGQPGA